MRMAAGVWGGDDGDDNEGGVMVVFFKRLKDSLVVVPLMCCAADMLAVPSKNQVVLVGKKSTLEMERMLLCFH
ncbi:hypothetical protein Tco_0167549 [Tanacetum coccineum]